MIKVTDDLLLAAAGILGLSNLPVVLAVSYRHDTAEALKAAQSAAATQLAATGLVDEYGDVADDLAQTLTTLTRPDRQLAARIVGEHGVRRVCLVRSGVTHALAIRDSDRFEVSTVSADATPAVLARLLRRALPAFAPADIAAFSAPAGVLRDRLDAATCSADFTDLAYGLGVGERDATEFGMAMSRCRSRAEIVAYSHEDGIAIRSSSAAAVYDTDRGRIIAGPSLTAAGEPWSTFAPGSDHRLAQAISGVVGSLPGGRWMP
jgi:hypothetical protein